MTKQRKMSKRVVVVVVVVVVVLLLCVLPWGGGGGVQFIPKAGGFLYLHSSGAQWLNW